MRKMDRRSFMKNTGVATGAFAASHFFHNGWFNSAYALSKGYFETAFGITDSMCYKVLQQALSKGGDFSELFFEHSISNSVSLEDGKVDRSYSSVNLGVGIRTVKGDQVGYGFTQELTLESMMAAAQTAATIADGSSKNISKKYVQLKTADYYPVQRQLSEIALSEKLPLVQAVNKKCFERSDLVIKVSANFTDRQKRIMIVTSGGNKTEDYQPLSYLYASVVAEKDGRQERSGKNYGGRKDFSFYTPQLIDKLASETVDQTLLLFDAVQPPAGEVPVVLAPGVTGILLHEAIGHGMEADFNRKELSTYSTMIGKKVAEPFVTIIDDGTNMHQTGSLNVDDEGTPSKKTVLVENGILTSYLHDLISSRHYKVEPTGNGRRESFEHYPLPRMRNTYMLAGDASPQDVIKNVKNGIYVEKVSNGQVKIGAGDFAFYVSQGNLIENGVLTAPVKDINIMGNGPKMLLNITMMANDLEMYQGGAGYCGKAGQSVSVSFGQPTCLVKSMTVGGVQEKGA
jgi:TldD protein